MKRMLISLVAVTTAIVSGLSPRLCARACSNPPTYNWGWPKGSAPTIDVSNLPTDLRVWDGSSEDTLDLQGLVGETLGELNSRLANNTDSQIAFSTGSTGAATDNCMCMDFVLDDPGAPVNTAYSHPNGNVDHAHIHLDPSAVGDYAHAGDATASGYAAGSGRTGSWTYWDPDGQMGAGGNSKADFIAAFKKELKHELLHGLGLDESGDHTSASCSATIMSGAYVPNNKNASGDVCGANPTDCDLQAVEAGYPPNFDDNPQWWYDLCGIDEETYNNCITGQSDAHYYAFDICTCTLGTSPIIVNIDGNDLMLTNVQNGVRFDLLATGSSVQTAWTVAGSRQGFLVLDRNGNGVIDDGSELFGNITEQPQPSQGQERNGFVALGVFDANGDGQITSVDPVFSRLRLWFDANHDGICQPEELATLNAVGIEAIDIRYHEAQRRDRFGNMLRYFSKIVASNGRPVLRATDVFFLWER